MAAMAMRNRDIASQFEISNDDIALYDRQIRLWGVQAQASIQNANILLISVRALANEVAKNLVLAGIKSITLQDSELLKESDLGAAFLLNSDAIGKPRAEVAASRLRQLNPRVDVRVDLHNITSRDSGSYGTYNIVIATDLDLNTLIAINDACRSCQTPFYAAATHGFYGYIFADLLLHDFVIEREISNRPATVGPETSTRSVIAAATKKDNGKIMEVITKRESYSPLGTTTSTSLPSASINNRRRKLQISPLLSAWRAWWELSDSVGTMQSSKFAELAAQKHAELQLPPESLTSDFLKAFASNAHCEIAPVTAFLGGQLAQDVINVLSRREQPIQNLLLFDGETSKGPVYSLHPQNT